MKVAKVFKWETEGESYSHFGFTDGEKVVLLGGIFPWSMNDFSHSEFEAGGYLLDDMDAIPDDAKDVTSEIVWQN